MKLKSVYFISIIFVLTSCGSLRKGSSRLSSDDVVNTPPKEQPKVEVKTRPEPVIEIAEEEVEPAPPTIVVREEKVTNVDVNEPDYNYYVIIGSFQSLDNARNFRSQLVNEGFAPIILESEIGFFRVSVAAFNEEQPTRNRIGQIRLQYPIYNDVWLLKKKR